MSCTLSTNSGSVDSLNVSDRCGCRPNAPQIRRMVVCDSPDLAAMERIDQCVASLGVVFSVRRPEEHTSELQSLMRNSYAVFCLNNKKHHTNLHLHSATST